MNLSSYMRSLTICWRQAKDRGQASPDRASQLTSKAEEKFSRVRKGHDSVMNQLANYAEGVR